MYLFKSVKLNKDVHTFLCSVSNVTEINNKFTFQGTLRLFRALYFGKNVRSLKARCCKFDGQKNSLI